MLYWLARLYCIWFYLLEYINKKEKSENRGNLKKNIQCLKKMNIIFIRKKFYFNKSISTYWVLSILKCWVVCIISCKLVCSFNRKKYSWLILCIRQSFTFSLNKNKIILFFFHNNCLKFYILWKWITNIIGINSKNSYII